jgi:hypothetical protein
LTKGAQKCVLTDCKIDTVLQDGQDTVLRDGQRPSYRTQSTVLQADLIERNRKENRKATPHLQNIQNRIAEGAGSTPLPSPAKRQAKALIERITPPITRMTEQEFQERRRRQIKALMESPNQVMA